MQTMARCLSVGFCGYRLNQSPRLTTVLSISGFGVDEHPADYLFIFLHFREWNVDLCLQLGRLSAAMYHEKNFWLLLVRLR